MEESAELFELQKDEVVEWFQQVVASLRTGRVTPDQVLAIQVDAYGAKTPLNGLASVSNTDARTLVVSPWDPGSAGDIVKALTEADLGVTPVVDGEVIRLSWPSLTEEIREQTVKTLHSRAEEARVRLRQARDEGLKLIKDGKEAGDLTEDDFYDGKKELDGLIDKANLEIDTVVNKKEEDVRAI